MRIAFWLGIATLCIPVAFGQQAPPLSADWWDVLYQYRMVVEVVEGGRRAGLNTVRVHLAEQSALCQADGRDVRVVAAGAGPVPHRVERREDGTLDVLFQAPPEAIHFHIYYGNPHADRQERTWPLQVGGLELETRPIARQIADPRQLIEALNQNPRRFDRRPWPQIDDMENPFGRSDLYMSIYEGTLYCPQTGSYTFAVNADDVAYFAIDGVVDPLCLRTAGAPSEEWRDPAQPRAVARVRLQKGVYRIRFYHAENFGTQLARLGWQTPDSDAIVTVPPEAFVTYLPAEILGRDVLGQALSPFFVARHFYNLTVNGRQPGFPLYGFQALLGTAGGQGEFTCQWDFGDGSTASGQQVEHEFPDMAERQVTLTVTDGQGRSASIVRPVAPPRGPVHDMSVRMQAQAGAWVIGEGEMLDLRVQLFGSAAPQRGFTLRALAAGAPGGEGLREQSVLLPPDPSARAGGWVEARQSYPARPGLELRVELARRGVVFAQETVRVLGSDWPLEGLRLDSAHNLRAEDGSLAVLHLANVARAAPRVLCELEGRVVRIVAIDALVAGPPGGPDDGGYLTALKKLLSDRWPGLRFELHRLALSGEAGWMPVLQFLELVRCLVSMKANLVLIVCQPESVINGVPADDFERYLACALDQVLARTAAAVVLVTPLPVPGQPELSRPYARLAKTVGLRKGIPVADLYSRFLLRPDWMEMFRTEGGAGTSFLLYPNGAGQVAVAHEVFATIAESFGRALDSAAR